LIFSTPRYAREEGYFVTENRKQPPPFTRPLHWYFLPSSTMDRSSLVAGPFPLFKFFFLLTQQSPLLSGMLLPFLLDAFFLSLECPSSRVSEACRAGFQLLVVLAPPSFPFPSLLYQPFLPARGSTVRDCKRFPSFLPLFSKLFFSERRRTLQLSAQKKPSRRDLFIRLPPPHISSLSVRAVPYLSFSALFSLPFS